MKWDNLFQSKWFIRGLALAFAIILFVFVNVEISTTQSDSSIPGRTTQIETLEDVPVEIQIDSENYVVSGVPEFATVSIEGTPAIVMPAILNRNFSVYVDLEGLEEGEHTVELEHDITSDLNVYIEPKTIDVVIEERATTEYPISVDFINRDNMPAGYEIVGYELDNPHVEITTSQAIMEQIGIVKVYVDVGGIDSSIQNREVPINVYDNQGNELQVRLDRETAVVSVEIDNPSKTVPVEIETTGDVGEDYTITSISANLDEVEIYAVSSVLANIDSISTEAIDLSDIEESETLEVSLDLPEGVNAGELATIEVEIEIEETQVLEGVSIAAENLDDEQDVTFISPENAEMDLRIIGERAIIEDLSQDDFQAIVDVSDLNDGDHVIDIDIVWDEVENITVVSEYMEAEITLQ